MAAALADQLLTQQGLALLQVTALYSSFVWSCGLTRHDLYCSHFTPCTHHRTLQPLTLGVCIRHFSVLRWKSSRTCRSPTGLHGGITLATREFLGSQHYIVSNSHKLVRAPRRLRSPCPSHRSRTAQRLQAPCPARSNHAALSSSQVPVGSTMFAEAATQLSFAELFAPTAQPPTLLLDAATQTSPQSVASADATTQPPLTEFCLGCIYSKDPLDRSVPPRTHGHVWTASLPQPSDIATINSLSSTSSTSCRHVCTPVPRVRLDGTPPLPPSLEGQALLEMSHNIPEDQAPLCSPHGIPVKAAPVRPLAQNIHLSSVPAATCKYHPSGNTC